MTAKHKNTSDGAHNQDNGAGDDDKIFDFDKAFDQTEEEQTEEPKSEDTAALENTIQDLKDKHLRLLAEFDNYKKRTSREKYDLMTTASRDVVLALLPVIDDFERALKLKDQSAGEGFDTGIQLIYNRMLNVLQSQGLKAMESTNETFDPDLHEAITEVPVKDPEDAGKIVDTIEKGYTLNDKIIRHAKVIVGK